MDQIEFEEWALKGLDKELSPKLWSSKHDLEGPALKTAEQSKPALKSQADKEGIVSDSSLLVECSDLQQGANLLSIFCVERI